MANTVPRDPAPHPLPLASALPALPPTPLQGRDALLVEIMGLLAEPGIVTLTGPGGVGKTRLALEIAHAWQARAHDTWFVPLGPIGHPDLVLPAIARAVGVTLPGALPPLDALAEALREERGLIVLDGVEHLTDVASALSALVRACPELTMLVTSQAPLRIGPEVVVTVPPLPVAAANPAASPAVRLFLDRARQASPDYAPAASDLRDIAAVCTRLSGLPLAIELAAAQSAGRPLDALLDHLDATPTDRVSPLGRHQSMREAIAWSEGLLAPEERQLFHRISIFAGGAPLSAIVTLASWPEPPSDATETRAIDLLTTLVDRHLVQRLDADAEYGEPRFGMLEVIRAHAAERLEAAGEATAAADAHAAIVLGIAKEGERHLLHEVDPGWLDRLEQEHANIRAALAWTLREGATGPQQLAGARIAAALWLFWYSHSHLREGRDWLERVVAVGPAVPPDVRGRAFVGLGTIEHFLGVTDRALAALEEGTALLEGVGDVVHIAYGLTGLGNIAEDAGRYDEAEVAFSSARARFEQADDRVNVAVTIYHLGVVAFGQGDVALARERLEMALAMSRALGDPWNTAASLSWLGLARIAAGEVGAAARALAEALALYRQLGTTERLVEGLRRVAVVAAHQGNDRPALRLFGAADAIGDRLGVGSALPERDLYDRALGAIADRLPPSRRRPLLESGAAQTLEEALAEAERVLDSVDDASPAGPHDLSPREIDVLRLMASGATDAEIARLLGISRRTVTTHTGHIYAKLGVGSRAAAVAWAHAQGLA